MPIHLPNMDPCYLCECVLAGSQGWNFIARDEHVLVLLNGRQYEVGQCMVLPVRHAPTLLELSDDGRRSSDARGEKNRRGHGRNLFARRRAALPEQWRSGGPGSAALPSARGAAAAGEQLERDRHISRPVVAGERAAHADYARITDTKIATVLELQQHLGKQA